SNPDKLHAYDVEIDKTFHKLISSHRSSAFAFDSSILKSDSDDFDSNANFNFGHTNSNSDFGVCISQFSLDNMTNNNRTLNKLATANFGLIHLLPKYHGLVGEDPYKNLKEFHVMCFTMRPHGIPELHQDEGIPFLPR
ncbi:hypothetical protein CR513_13283, partial [Mucuna pruriens]